MRALTLLLLPLMVLPSCSGSQHTAWPEGEDVLFVRAEAEEAPAMAAEPWAVRAEPVRLNNRIFRAEGVTVGDTVAFDVFGERRLQAVVAAVDSVRNLQNVRARLLPPDAGDLLLTTGAERAVGLLHWQSAARTFRLRYDQRLGQHVLAEADPSREDVLPGAPPLMPPPRPTIPPP